MGAQQKNETLVPWLIGVQKYPHRFVAQREYAPLECAVRDMVGQPVAVQLAAARALQAVAECVPRDEVRMTGEAPKPSLLLENLCQRLLQSKVPNPEERVKLTWCLANATFLKGHHHGKHAMDLFKSIVNSCSSQAAFWGDFARAAKWCGDWAQVKTACGRALELGDPNARGTLWNLALANTALRGLAPDRVSSQDLVEVWSRLGIQVRSTAGGLPVTLTPLPEAHVRVPVRDGTGPVHFERCAVTPLSPAHGVITSPCFAEQTPVDFGDVIMWDGLPVSVDDQGTPCFALLEILRRGDEHRVPVVGMVHDPSDVEDINRALPPGVNLYARRQRVVVTCPRCASGERWTAHEHEEAQTFHLLEGKLVVPQAGQLEPTARAMDGFMKSSGRCQLAMPALFEALGDTRRAGKEHRLWGGILRGLEQNASSR